MFLEAQNVKKYRSALFQMRHFLNLLSLISGPQLSAMAVDICQEGLPPETSCLNLSWTNILLTWRHKLLLSSPCGILWNLWSHYGPTICRSCMMALIGAVCRSRHCCFYAILQENYEGLDIQHHQFNGPPSDKADIRRLWINSKCLILPTTK